MSAAGLGEGAGGALFWKLAVLNWGMVEGVTLAGRGEVDNGILVAGLS